VFEMMRDCGKPAVGHNLLMDLSYSVESFVEPLPPSWEEYKALVAAWLPTVYDTKHLVAQMPEIFNDTSLGCAYEALHGGARRSQVWEGRRCGMLSQILAGEGDALAAVCTRKDCAPAG
jgi:CAF1 family ribonuclease